MWRFNFDADPLSSNDHKDLALNDSLIVTASTNVKDFVASTDNRNLSNAAVLDAFEEGGKAGRTTLAHLVAQKIADFNPEIEGECCGRTVFVEPLHLLRRFSQKQRSTHKNSNRRRNSSKRPSSFLPPYIFERSDIWCDETTLNITLAVIFKQDEATGFNNETQAISPAPILENLKRHLLKYFGTLEQSMPSSDTLLAHVANTVLQIRIRELLPSKDAVAFLANGSIMPRKSGASFAPMSSPPAIPFMAPKGSSMTQDIKIEMGKLCKYLKIENFQPELNTITLSGLFVPKGITLIVGGGYHGKSTMLRTIMAGVYNKILGDGRELCVTDCNAVTVRAEDGRYVNNTNVSAFISNLPIVGSDTSKFSTREASGSTSQAANVSEAIEMGAGAILVDEDVSAANFMSRDGRMRALVMDESITPLLYRVNGLYAKHGISSIVVVGGVGDWLDVPNAVIKLDRYVASDALEKAKSISSQFSHNHVQYGGRGTVHRLPWDSDGTPCRRHPIDLEMFGDMNNCRLSLLDGGGKLSLLQAEETDSDASMDGYDSDDDIGIIDMTRCEQLFGGKFQLYGCGICVVWLLKHAKSNPELDLNELVDALDKTMNQSGGIGSIMDSLRLAGAPKSPILLSLIENLGHVYRPRKHEILMALTRIRGVKFGELPTEVDEEDLKLKREAEERKRALAELWANRRKK